MYLINGDIMHTEDWCLCDECIPETTNELEENKMKLLYLIVNNKMNGVEVDGNEQCDS